MTRFCINPDCSKRASFNILGQNPNYCYLHKTDDMIYVNANLCINPVCSKQANYNILGQKAKYCVSHKTVDMIRINSNICISPDCFKIAHYNILGQKAKYCASHKTVNMIDNNGDYCINPDCSKRASFNILGQPRRYCASHKTENMIQINANLCINPVCSKQANYNILGQKAKYCVSHKTDDMININAKKCHLCAIYVIKNNKYRGYCVRCFIHTFPTETVSRNYKTKERNVVDCIKTMFPDLDWKEDKIIYCGCSKRRPDMLLDIVYCVIVIEIDENQHTDYDSNCESKRMMEISQDVGHRPVVFIRFNPDEYKNASVKITSCWGTDGNGLSVVKKCKTNEWKERTDTLNKQIQYCIDNPSDKMIDVIHLFYDLP